MRLIHKGVRPKFPIELVDYKRGLFEEQCLDGKRPLWNSRMLNSGCQNVFSNVKERDGLYYCPCCDEWFSKNQWEELP